MLKININEPFCLVYTTTNTNPSFQIFFYDGLRFGEIPIYKVDDEDAVNQPIQFQIYNKKINEVNKAEETLIREINFSRFFSFSRSSRKVKS